jgi:predicted RNA-binding protein (virulence factor B family)
MIELGKFARLEVVKEVDFGVYLAAGEDEILLPLKYVPAGLSTGDEVDVFIYRDNENRVIATTLRPHAVVGECAYMEVREVSPFGAFLDWGIHKDLLVPFSEQPFKLLEGMYVPVMVYLDDETNRIVGSCRVNKFIKNDVLEVEEGQEVNLLIGESTDLGVKVVINNKHWGILYHNEVFKPIDVGEKLVGFIKKIREDHKIDVALQKQGYDEITNASDRIISLLKENKGFLPLTDKSDPETIYEVAQMSKKVFKKAIGALYKARKVELRDSGVHLVI